MNQIPVTKRQPAQLRSFLRCPTKIQIAAVFGEGRVDTHWTRKTPQHFTMKTARDRLLVPRGGLTVDLGCGRGRVVRRGVFIALNCCAERSLF